MSFDKLHEYLTGIYTDECCAAPLSLVSEAGLAAGDGFKNALQAIKKAFDEAVIFIHGKKGFNAKMLAEKPVRNLITEINGMLQKAVKEGIAYEVPEVMKQHLQKDVFMFSGMKTYAEMKEASGLLMDSKGGIKSLPKFTEDVKKIHTTYNENYLRAERNFAVGSAQNSSKWGKYETEKERYDLKYMTDNGPNVRQTHRALEGTVLPVDDPFWNSYAPKNGWNCHCFLLQVRKGDYTVSDSAEAIVRGDKATTQIGKDGKNKAAMFRFNPGKEMKIFPPGHPLFNPKDGGRALEEVKRMIK